MRKKMGKKRAVIALVSLLSFIGLGGGNSSIEVEITEFTGAYFTSQTICVGRTRAEYLF